MRASCPPPITATTGAVTSAERNNAGPRNGAPSAAVPVRAGARGSYRGGMRSRALELARFGSVGAVAYVVDIGLFNLLRFGPGGLLEDKPITAKVLSVAVATLVAWIGNRYWTFSARRTASPRRELVVFAVVNVGGMLVAVGCLAFSHYVLGLALGTAFRYVAYRRLVFTGAAAPHDVPSAAADDEPART